MAVDVLHNHVGLVTSTMLKLASVTAEDAHGKADGKANVIDWLMGTERHVVIGCYHVITQCYHVITQCMRLLTYSSSVVLLRAPQVLSRGGMQCVAARTLCTCAHGYIDDMSTITYLYFPASSPGAD